MVNAQKHKTKTVKAYHSSKNAETTTKSTALWSQLGYSCQKGETRDWLVKKLENMRSIVSTGLDPKSRPQVTRELQRLCAVGTNGATKALEQGRCRVLVISRDAPDILHNHVVEAANIKRTAVVVMPKSSISIGKALAVKRASCIALLSQQPAAEPAESSVSMQLSAIHDEICDVLLRHASTPPATAELL